MPIPEAQLETWSHQGSVAQSSNTYSAIKGTLEGPGTPYAGKNYQVFLQGSYGNDTNIYAESDVDVVIKLNDCFHTDLSQLPADQKLACELAFPKATYTFADFKRDVLSVLTTAYGRDVAAGKKAVSIAANGGRRKADVVAAVQFRRYIKFISIGNEEYIDGICFFTSNGDMIANYPRQHSANLTAKHQATANRLKSLVRVLKNLRGKLVDDGVVKPGLAPSYYLEGLLYNVPDSEFADELQVRLSKALTWIFGADRGTLVCANYQHWLVRDGSPTSWPKADFDKFLKAAIALWNNWK